MATHKTLRAAVLAEATSMARGMLRHPDEAIVLGDLAPAFIQMRPEALEQARRSMKLARRTQFPVAERYLLDALPQVIDGVAQQAPELFDQLEEQARKSSLERVAGGFADFFVSSAMAFLLPVFEAASRESPSRPPEDHSTLDAVRLYVQTADQLTAMWQRTQAELARAGLNDFSPLNADHLAGGGLKETLQLVLPSERLFMFIDCRIVRRGELGALDRVGGFEGLAVVRLPTGQFVVWAAGREAGRHNSLDDAMSHVNRLAPTLPPARFGR